MQDAIQLNHVILVNEQDEAIATEEKIKAHRLGLRHRAISIFIYRDINSERQWLIQQRHKNKYHCGGLWTNTVCSHPKPNESTAQAAARRLQEEMGFSVPLIKKGQFHYMSEFDNGLTENEIDHVYMGQYDGSVINPEPTEVQDYRWTDFKTLQNEMLLSPHQFTPWLTYVIQTISQPD